MNGTKNSEILQPQVGRRTSARVSARAESSSQSASKRKRNDNTELDNEIEDVQSTSEDTSESEDEQDDEDEPEGTRRQRNSNLRPPPKRARTKGDKVSLTIRTAPKKSGKSKKPRPVNLVEAAKAIGGLYGMFNATSFNVYVY